MKSLIILPTYNERDNIQILIKEIFSLPLDCHILVVDDNSPDNTAHIVNKMAEQDGRIHLIQRQNKLGLGSAYIEGFHYALKHSFDYIFEMDADFSHSPKYLSEFLDKIKDYDLVIGSRYVKGGKALVDWPAKRRLLSYLANLYVRILTGLPVKDSTSGFKCFRKEVLQNIDLDQIKSDGYSFQIEVKFICWRKGFRICEIPITFKSRRTGHSKMSRKIAREASIVVWRLAFQRLLGKKYSVTYRKNKNR